MRFPFLALAICFFIQATASLGQPGNSYFIPQNSTVKFINLHLQGARGHCNMSRCKQKDVLVNVITKEPDSFKNKLSHSVKNETCHVDISHGQDGQYHVSHAIRDKFISHTPEDEMQVFLAKDLPLYLNLNYVIGKANVNLSHLSVKRLKINTGSADVSVGYDDGGCNPIEMDTFDVDVDFGTLSIDNLHQTRSAHINAGVGFGKLHLNFNDTLMYKSHVVASVGAGMMYVRLPSNDFPLIIKIHDSPLCSVEVFEGLKKLDPYTYVSSSYDKDAPNLLSFDVDVAMGKIAFIKE